MGLRNLAIYENLVAPTPPEGATPLTLVGSPTPVVSGFQLICSDDTDFTSRRAVTFKSKPPIFDQKTKKWSRATKMMNFVAPRNSADGSIVYDGVRIEIYTQAESDSTDIQKLIAAGIWMLSGLPARTFLETGTLD